MNPESEAADPLSWAIRALREELLRWIDTELVRLRAREQAENRLMEEGPATAAGSQFGASSSRLGANPGRRDLQLGLGWHESRTRERVVERDSSLAETARPPVDAAELETDPKPQVPPSDPRQRLDALARLLDDRIKRAQGAAGTWSGAGSGPNADVDDEHL